MRRPPPNSRATPASAGATKAVKLTGGSLNEKAAHMLFACRYPRGDEKAIINWRITNTEELYGNKGMLTQQRTRPTCTGRIREPERWNRSSAERDIEFLLRYTSRNYCRQLAHPDADQGAPAARTGLGVWTPEKLAGTLEILAKQQALIARGEWWWSNEKFGVRLQT